MFRNRGVEEEANPFKSGITICMKLYFQSIAAPRTWKGILWHKGIEAPTNKGHQNTNNKQKDTNNNPIGNRESQTNQTHLNEAQKQTSETTKTT